jgi:hypothetical protein
MNSGYLVVQQSDRWRKVVEPYEMCKLTAMHRLLSYLPSSRRAAALLGKVMHDETPQSATILVRCVVMSDWWGAGIVKARKKANAQGRLFGAWLEMSRND